MRGAAVAQAAQRDMLAAGDVGEGTAVADLHFVQLGPVFFGMASSLRMIELRVDSGMAGMGPIVPPGGIRAGYDHLSGAGGRRHPTAPAAPGKPVRVEHEFRHGALALLAALDVHTGTVFASTPATTGIKPFMALIGQVMALPEYNSAPRVFVIRRISEHEQADSTRQQADLTQAAWQPAANHGLRARLVAGPA